MKPLSVSAPVSLNLAVKQVSAGFTFKSNTTAPTVCRYVVSETNNKNIQTSLLILSADGTGTLSHCVHHLKTAV